MDTETQMSTNKGISVILYRLSKLKTAFNDGSLLKGILRFVLHFLVFLLILPFAGLYAFLSPCILRLRKDLKKAFDDLTPSSAERRKVDFIDFLVACLMVTLYIVFLIILYILSLPFLTLYWMYQFLERLCSYALIQWLIVLLVLSGVAYGCIKLIATFMRQSAQS